MTLKIYQEIKCKWCDRQMRCVRKWKQYCNLNCKRAFEKAVREIGGEILMGELKLEAIPKNSKTFIYLNRR